MTTPSPYRTTDRASDRVSTRDDERTRMDFTPLKRTYAPRSWIDARLKARPSAIQGLGLFAHAPIKEGETVVIWGGRLFSRADLDVGVARDMSAVPLTDDLYLGLYAQEKGDIDEYMNHSCDPNAGLVDEVTLVATRDIAPREEVTLDYATFEIDAQWVIPCGCGASICRGVVTGSDWQLEQLQAKYQGRMSPFIQHLIRQRSEQSLAAGDLGEQLWR